MLKRNRRRVDSIVEAASRQVGYHAQPQKRNVFGLRNHDGQEWNGAFVQRILRDAFGTEPEVSFISTVTALGYYSARGRLYRRPRVGDVVFYNFSTDPREWDRQPHVGIVIELRPGGAFRAIEGQTFSGKPQGVQLADGVHERERYETDVIAVVRPKPRRAPEPVTGERTTLKMSYFSSNGKTVARAIETVQLALNRLNPKLTFNRGKRDGVFKSALGLYGRETGMPEARGEVEPHVLKRLADETGLSLE